jgi:ubiquinone/menaquinone biosynthesis C-methylase UbiE
MASDNLKSQVQAQFGSHAQGYVQSKTHAQGAELDRLIELAQPEKEWRILDVATGGGHTALTFSRSVRQSVAYDLTFPMLQAARQFIQSQGASNVIFANGDAENLPFAPETFQLVTCRIAAHHFPDVFKFVQACYRVLARGGLLLVQDQVLPAEKCAAHYVDSFEKLRDPSHNRAYDEYEWHGVFLDADFAVEHSEMIIKRHELLPWAQRLGCTAMTLEQLQVLLLQAPLPVKEWMLPEYAGTEYATFCNRHIIIAGRKN